MSLRRLGVGRLGLLAVIVGVSPLASACSSDASVDFTPIGGSSFGASTTGGNGSAGDLATGGTSSNAGSSATAGDAAMGGNAQGGNALGGTGATAGNAGASGDAGMNAGGMAGASGNAMGGDAGMAMGGNAMGGNAMGGDAGMTMGGNAGGGNPMGGSAGTGGNPMGGSAGTGGNSGGSGGMGGGNNCTPSAEICDGVDNNCDNQIDPKGTCPDACTGATFNGHRYMFCGAVSNISSDVAICTGASMSTLTIESPEENAFILGKIGGDTWLGGSDAGVGAEGVWRWVPTNHVFWNKGDIQGEYENWAMGRPTTKDSNNEDCMVIVDSGGSAGKWNDIVCDSGGKRAACEAVAP